MRTSCEAEFPGNVVPSDRYIDLSLPRIQLAEAQWPWPLNLLVDMDTDTLIKVVALAGAGGMVLGCTCCLFCACYFDDSCCRTARRRRKSTDGQEGSGDSDSDDDNDRLAQTNFSYPAASQPPSQRGSVATPNAGADGRTSFAGGSMGRTSMQAGAGMGGPFALPPIQHQQRPSMQMPSQHSMQSYQSHGAYSRT